MADEIETTEVESEIEVGAPEPEAEPEQDGEVEASGEGDEQPDGEPKPKPKAAEPKSTPRTYKAKANGKEIDVPAEHVDALASLLGVDPNEIVRGSQMLRAGQERLRTAAEAERKAKAISESLKRDPFAALREAGLPEAEVQKATIAYVARLYEEEQLKAQNPAEYEKRQLQEQLRQRDEADKTRAQQAEEQEAQAYQQQVAARLDTEVRTLLEKGKIPAHPYAIKRIAAHMLDMSEKGIDPEDISAEDFVPVVLEDMRKDFSTFIGSLSGEDVLRMFPELSEKVRKAHLAKVPPRQTPKVKPREEREAVPQPRPRKTPSDVLRDFMAGK